MKELPEKIIDLKPDSKEAISALREQLNRDLSKVCDLEFSSDLFEPKKWIFQLSEILKQLNDNQFSQLLYVVDLPENWSANLRDTDFPHISFAEAVLQREWQKVYFRRMFS